MIPFMQKQASRHVLHQRMILASLDWCFDPINFRTQVDRRVGYLALGDLVREDYYQPEDDKVMTYIVAVLADLMILNYSAG